MAWAYSRQLVKSVLLSSPHATTPASCNMANNDPRAMVLPSSNIIGPLWLAAALLAEVHDLRRLTNYLTDRVEALEAINKSQSKVIAYYVKKEVGKETTGDAISQHADIYAPE
ncbi:hypothetical protein J1614_006976 [Plenodomus biglobosus]|nr:hypothetical protein J1614_006976 [Plenodomus biglobosus]